MCQWCQSENTPPVLCGSHTQSVDWCVHIVKAALRKEEACETSPVKAHLLSVLITFHYCAIIIKRKELEEHGVTHPLIS